MQVWDEGMPVLSDGAGAFARDPIAFVGTAEKGRTPFTVTLTTKGGHASMPATDGSHAAANAARVIRSIDKMQPPLQLRSPVTDMLQHLAPRAPPFLRHMLENASTGCATACKCIATRRCCDLVIYISRMAPCVSVFSQ